MNVRWEQRWTLRETEASSQNDALIKTLQHQRDRILLDHQSSEQHVLELENEVSHLRIKLQEAVSHARIQETSYRNNNNLAMTSDVPASPTFTEDMGPASPLSPSMGYMSPVMRGPPPPLSVDTSLSLHNNNSDFRAIRDEKNKLRLSSSPPLYFF